MEDGKDSSMENRREYFNIGRPHDVEIFFWKGGNPLCVHSHVLVWSSLWFQKSLSEEWRTKGVTGTGNQDTAITRYYVAKDETGQYITKDESKCVSKERADGVYEETFLKFIGILYRTPVSVQTFAELSRMCELCEELIAIEAVNIELQAAILNWDSDRWREEILSDLPKALELAYRLKSKLLYREIYTHTAGWAARDLSTSHSKILEVLPKEVAMPVLKDALKINTAVKRLYHACFKMYFEFRPSVNTCDPLDTIYNRVLGKIPENPENETAESLAKFFEAIRNLPKEMFTHRNLKADTELRRVFIRNGIASLPLYMETALLEAAFLLKNRLRFTEAYSPKDLNYLTCAYVEESELPWLKGESSMDEFWSEAVSSLLSLL